MTNWKRSRLLVTTALVAGSLAVLGVAGSAAMARGSGGESAAAGGRATPGTAADAPTKTAAAETDASTESDLKDLFNPAYLSRAVCGMGGARSKRPAPLSVQVATAATGTMTDAGPASRSGSQALADQPDQPPLDQPRSEQPLWDNLGDLTVPITTSAPDAQRYFDQGVRLANGFNHAEALRSFRVAQRKDPQCAMCFWGEALVLGPNINAPMAPEAVAPAVAAITRAQALSDTATDKEKALIWALARRYSANPTVDRAALDANYADALGEVAKHYPDDQTVAVLYAEAMMNTQPWDYWEADRRTPKGRTAEVISTLERVLAANPDHPAAIHLYIHITEASTTPERAEPYADRLGTLMPGAGHIVHMPSHVYFRVGRYRDSLAANVAAVRADEAYLAAVQAEGIYPGGYYPHNIHYVVESARMAGAAETALEYAEKLEAVLREDILRTIPWVQVIKVAPYYAHAQFSDLQTVLAVPEPTLGLPYVEAMWHYMRGVAFAARGQVEQARTEAASLARIAETNRFDDMVGGGVPAPAAVGIAGHVLAARIAQATGDLETAETEYRAAVTAQDGLAYMEPPYWYYPVRQSLGAVLLAQGRPGEAEQVFRRTLMNFPNNGWALFGLMQAQAAQQDKVGADWTARALEQTWLGDRNDLALARL